MFLINLKSFLFAVCMQIVLLRDRYVNGMIGPTSSSKSTQQLLPESSSSALSFIEWGVNCANVLFSVAHFFFNLKFCWVHKIACRKFFKSLVNCTINFSRCVNFQNSVTLYLYAVRILRLVTLKIPIIGIYTENIFKPIWPESFKKHYLQKIMSITYYAFKILSLNFSLLLNINDTYFDCNQIM